MNTPIEDLVRNALEHQAHLAPAPERVRAALPARTARRARRRQYGLLAGVATATAVTAAITIPTVVLRDAGPGGSMPAASADRTAAPPPAVPSAVPPGAPVQVALDFHPTWLPAGLAERSRFVPLTDPVGTGAGPSAGTEPVRGVQRIWTRNPVGANDQTRGPRIGMSILTLPDGKSPFGTEGTPIDINGHAGRYVDAGAEADKAYLHWKVDADTVISVDQHDLGLTREQLARVARSVRPVATAVQVPLRAGWLPAGLRAEYAIVSGDSPAVWSAQLAGTAPQTGGAAGKDKASLESKQEPRSVDLVLGTAAVDVPGGEAITVQGRPARYSPTDDQGAPIVVVDLGGRWLTVRGPGRVTGPISREDLIRVAEHAEVAPQPDVSWIGTR
ncbi:MAG TPA: hypothetical protein VK453_05840 [Micromonosporaceae bacterium]|nr:hypothetical protein [Micromonosporaceae bacterium]